MVVKTRDNNINGTRNPSKQYIGSHTKSTQLKVPKWYNFRLII